MIEWLMTAAKIAAAAGDANNTVTMEMLPEGIQLCLTHRAPDGTTKAATIVRWQDLAEDPRTLFVHARQYAAAADGYCAHQPVIRLTSNMSKPPVRLLQPEEWPLAIVSALAILIAIPIGGGLLL